MRLTNPVQLDLVGSLKAPVAIGSEPLGAARGKRALASADGPVAGHLATAMRLAEARNAAQASTEVELTLKAPSLSNADAERR